MPGEGDIKQFKGIKTPYEAGNKPWIMLDTGDYSAEKNVALVLESLI